MEGPVLRHATQDDVPTILALIHELALYENATSSVQATEEKLLKTLSFAPHSASSTSDGTATSGFAKALLIVAPEGGVAGMALYFYNYSTWTAAPGIYLEDLFVRPPFRRRGYATMLIKELAREVRRMDGARLEWACLKWNESALKFYESLGAVQKSEWVGLRVDGERLKALAG
ncbi:GCN5-related N-acetyltransferas-like protein [Lineolata rhizophorae]|uniref:GCN5-related N-acetyltransferas-like protein n=1 Tax=Lineolata rhizophorae TaxID=578093 RepID=A0A6A6NX16_9PEZI|nr:GCN5-related N-acetyltransferas-like protein [Lineolata rhizophorae]